MLEFSLNNKPFLLSSETSVRILWSNPACKFDKIDGNAGIGISIPVNDHNKSLLRNPGRFEKISTKNNREFKGFEIRFGGVLLLSGTLIVNSADDASYECWLRGIVGDIGDEHREKYIYDIDAFGEEVIWENKSDYDPVEDDYCCPTVFNPEFFSEKGRTIPIEYSVPNLDYYPGSLHDETLGAPETTEAFSHAFWKTSEYFINSRNQDGSIKTLSNSMLAKLSENLEITVVSPMLFLNNVLRQLFNDAHIFIDEDAIRNDVDLKTLLLYNNFDITSMQYTQLPEMWVPDIRYDGTTMNGYYVEPGLISRNYLKSFQYKDLLPKVKLKDFLLGIQNLLNVCFVFKSNNKVDIIDRETIFSSEAINIEEYMVGSWKLDEQKNVTLKFSYEHDTNDIIFAERWTDISDRLNDLKESVYNWSELPNVTDPQLGDIRYLTSLDVYAEYKLMSVSEPDPVGASEIITDALGWEHFSIGFQPGFYNPDQTEEEEIKTCFSTLVCDPYPIVFQPGNVEGIRFAYQKFEPRLLFYRGNNIALNSTGNLSLSWDKEDIGLFSKRWAKWNRFWSKRQPVVREAQLPLNVIANIKENITSKLSSKEGEFIIEEMETEFSLNSIGATVIKGFKI
ncbi:hypothetical protein [uncultured Draconibacterium sp.]|uniref:hypothetical protein n=1 Tax=uncultured Draconibacterium sp. TaxID=1573823 RepID=UPI0025DE1B10|nr:hypothetical protein [uncultured Draconibacterium sp.]